jgi:hypothetical protein
VKLKKTWIAGTIVAAVLAVVSPLSPATNAFAAAPSWEPDANSNGTITFYDPSGAVMTGGNDLSHLFDFAAASSAEDPTGFHKAAIFFAFPDHTKTNTSDWFASTASAATTYPLAAPPSLAALPATTPVATTGTGANLTAALGGAILDGTAGYANIVQVRLLQSGGTNFWASDISYDSAAGTWTQVFPVVATATTTTTGLAASPVGHQTVGGTVTLTATLSPSNSDGAVQFKDGASDIGSPVAVTSGTAQTTVTTLSAGAHSLSASFTPTDPSAFAASSSSALPYSIGDLPGAPSGVAGTAGNQAVSLSWTAPASDGGSAITGYDVQYSANAGSTWTSAPASASTTPSRAVGGLTNGTSYVFRVAAINSIGEGAFSGQSAAVVPVADGSSLTIGTSATVNYGAIVTLRTVLKDTRTNAAIPSASVVLYRRFATSGAVSLVKTVTTSSTGAAAFAVKMTRFTQFQWRYAGTATHKAAVSALQTIKVAQIVSIRTTTTSIVHGHAVKLYGTVAPAVSGQVVYLQQLTATGWRNVASVAEKLQKLPNGVTTVGYVFARTLSSRGTYTFRVYKSATSTLLAGASARLSVRST